MLVIIPMAGSGQRFVDAGYTDPKPLIKLSDGRMILEHVLDMFTPEDRLIFICNDRRLETTDMRTRILALRPEATILSMPQHKLGPVHTCLPALPYVNPDEEVIISYCDGTAKWDRQAFCRHVADKNLDGAWITHSGFHPHTLSSTKMAFMREVDGLATDVQEKQSFTDDPMAEHASSGVYYFRRGEYVKTYLPLAIERDLSYNGEFYVTLVYKLMIQDGLRIGYFDSQVAILGTPTEVQNFEAWATILVGGQVRGETDLLKCYEYWREWHDGRPARNH